MPLQTRHKVGILTAGVIALATVFIPHWEGEQHRAIHNAFDPPGVVTVCNGHTNLDDPDLKEGDYYTAAMCADVLAIDLPKYNRQLTSCLPKDLLVSDHEHVSLLSFEYNIGERNFCRSTVARELRAGHRQAACRAMGAFTRANGVVLKGLHNRRYDGFWGEIAWCLRDD